MQPSLLEVLLSTYVLLSVPPVPYGALVEVLLPYPEILYSGWPVGIDPTPCIWGDLNTLIEVGCLPTSNPECKISGNVLPS